MTTPVVNTASRPVRSYQML